jgi:hypothetical protein
MALSNVNTAWKQDLYKMVNKTFEYEYANKMNKLLTIVNEEDNVAVDYRLEGLSGYGEFTAYNGTSLVAGNQSRGFIKIITPQEFNKTVDIGFKSAKIDKLGETKKVGTRLGYGASMSVYLQILRMFGRAFNANYAGGDGKAWAAIDHPNASKGDAAGTSIVDSDSGTYSNLITSALSIAAITTAQTAANRFVCPDGLPFMCDMDTLLVSPELESKAIEYCGKDSRIDLQPKLIPESAENGSNPLVGMKYIIIGGGSDGFSAKQWAICDRTLLKEVAKIVYITRPTVMETDLDDPLVHRTVGYFDCGVGFGDGRPIIFSSPA